MGNQNVLSVKPNFFSINFIMDAAILIQMLNVVPSKDPYVHRRPYYSGGTLERWRNF